jgi:UDP-GlcNAc:undecaprenyl-phosphate/decaprenyl-phosphate GlcNAc-1-phosphate transferase
VTRTVAIIATAVLAAVLAERGALLSMRVARRTDFYDHPGGYKTHGTATPYLGGAAVLLALLIAVSLLTGAIAYVPVILTCAVLLAALGTIDDRLTVSPWWRLLAEALAATALWAAHRGFTVFDSGALDLGLTIVWVVGIVNAFNLFDNIDGACASVAGISAVGVGVLGLIDNEWHVAALSLAIAGACAGFLRHNLSKPARIFLGDGGSMPLGFLIASLTMVVARGRGLGADELLLAGLLAGLPVLDTTLVTISRRRRGLSILKGGRDHLTHRLLARLGTPLRVAVVLGSAQAGLVVLAVIGDASGPTVLTLFGLMALVLGAAAVVVLESPGWTPVPAGARALSTGNGHVQSGIPVETLEQTFAEPTGMAVSAAPGTFVEL